MISTLYKVEIMDLYDFSTPYHYHAFRKTTTVREVAMSACIEDSPPLPIEFVELP
jgi:hypothetical protein